MQTVLFWLVCSDILPDPPTPPPLPPKVVEPEFFNLIVAGIAVLVAVCLVAVRLTRRSTK